MTPYTWLTPLLAGAIGAVFSAWILGWALVDPRSTDWLMTGDYALHFLGWHLFRAAPWTLPLGANPLLLWPVGGSIGLTDSIPIAAFIFKALDPLLPATFQFIGVWLVLCFALQGVFGVLLVRLATPRADLQLLGSLLFIFSPPLLFRVFHAALVAHWLLLAALWLSLKPAADKSSWRNAAAWAALAALAAAVQPYLMLMVVVLMLAAYARQVLTAPHDAWRVAAALLFSLAAALCSLWQSGSLGVGTGDGLQVGGFGVFSANLLTFIMPTEISTLFSPGPFPYAKFTQYEGYAYLGAGTLVLGIIAAVTRLLTMRSLPHAQGTWTFLPLSCALLFCGVMALGPGVTAGSRTLLTYDSDWWGPLVIFRTHARMIWPVYYMLVTVIVLSICRLAPRRALVLLAAAVLMQTADVVVGASKHHAELRTMGYRDPLRNQFWDTVPRHYQRLALVPTNLCTHSGAVDLRPFVLLAGRVGLPINAGLAARYDLRRAEAYCEQLRREVVAGQWSTDTLYIVRQDALANVLRDAAQRPLCTMVDGFGVCFSPESYQRWRGDFDVARTPLPSTSDFLGFHAALNDVYHRELGRPSREDEHVAARVDGVVRYLAYRMSGCKEEEARDMVLRSLAAPTAVGLCADVSTTQELPQPDQTLAFTRQLDVALQRMRGVAGHTSYLDLEGEAVWLHAYARARAAGTGDSTARNAVLAALRTAAGTSPR